MSDRLREALDSLYKDNHRWSSRPCATCSAITNAVGFPFGCDRMAGRIAAAPAEQSLTCDTCGQDLSAVERNHYTVRCHKPGCEPPASEGDYKLARELVSSLEFGQLALQIVGATEGAAKKKFLADAEFHITRLLARIRREATNDSK